MRKGRNLLIVVALLAIVGAAGLGIMHDREPRYAGHTLSYWVQAQDSPEAARAIQAIGTNAIPYLLRWIGEEPPGWKNKLARVHVPMVCDNPRLLRLLYGPAAPEGVAGFAILRSNATAAIPQLVTIMNDPTRPDPAINAMSALACIGEQALAPLTAVSKSSRPTRAHMVEDPCGEAINLRSGWTAQRADEAPALRY